MLARVHAYTDHFINLLIHVVRMLYATASSIARACLLTVAAALSNNLQAMCLCLKTAC